MKRARLPSASERSAKRRKVNKAPQRLRPWAGPLRVVPYQQGGRFPNGTYASGAEIKAIDILDATYGFTAPAGGTQITLLNGIQTGTGFFNRIGSRIEMKSLRIRGFIYYALTSIQDAVRIIVVYDRQPTGALPTIANLLQGRDQVGTTQTAGSSEINLDNRDRFTIVRDHRITIPSCTVAAGVLTNGPSWSHNQTAEVDLFIKLKGLVTHYNSTANPCTIANIATGALYVYHVGDTQSATVGFNGNFRLRFDDK